MMDDLTILRMRSRVNRRAEWRSPRAGRASDWVTYTDAYGRTNFFYQPWRVRMAAVMVEEELPDWTRDVPPNWPSGVSPLDETRST